ncbi:cytochrome P450 [Leucogyrophana mollusca]|uniref:Cytochrome P450 n=1 Tax=Leucogyrophana mollusca TaxID=85980 RepID=A0ACB8BX78_9AGAM|nr:cytochrome P450 [Leucogyrophana mollusca]
MSLAAVAAIFAVALVIVNHNKKGERPPLPPGPPPLPIVGNVSGIDLGAPWLSYAKWGRLYGDLVYTRFFSQVIIIVNSEKVAKDLLDRRSHNYSDRPFLPTIAPFGLGFNTVLFRYGPLWRFHRRLFHQALRPQAALAYRPMQMQKGFQLLKGILETPENYVDHLHLHSGSIIMSAVYNYEAEDGDDPFLRLIQRAVDIVIEDVRPELSSILGAFPILLNVFNLPSWVPGIRLNKRAAESRECVRQWVEKPFQYTEETMAAGTATPSLVSNALRKIEGEDQSGEVRQVIKDVAATAFAAGAETTNSTLRAFILAMVLYPEVQERAQKLIDSVVGSERLPNFDDRSSMPYLEAILRETLRWHPTFPLSLPHAPVDDDIYNGYLIPKGAMIIPNVWAMSHDESVYPNSHEFIPERFLDSNGDLTDDTAQYAFGFGRRNCVGRYVADASLWSAIALMLATFKFAKVKDNDGNDINFEVKWSAGITSHPLPFPLTITPRVPGMDATMLDQLISATNCQI